MPTLPLYLPNPGHADASHRVTAPGGYEWWYFDGESNAGDLRFVARLYDGFPWSEDYLRRYDRYLRTPTRHAPPVPSEYPRVEFALYEKGRQAQGVVSGFARGSMLADVNRPDVRVGPHQFQRRDDGSLHLRLQDPSLSADLVFRPLLPHRTHEQVLLPRDRRDAEHHRILSDPLCSIEGSVSTGNGLPVLRFSGRGYHDHHYGAAPPMATWKSWTRGRAIIGDAVYVFHHTTPRHGGRRDVSQLTVVDFAGVREVPAEGLAFERSSDSLRFGRELILSNPRRVDWLGQGCLFLYDARAGGGTGTALCEDST
jgi:hypothetical protein